MMLASCGNQTNSTMETDKPPMFGLGNQIGQNFTGRAWLNNLSVLPTNDCNVYNVTFDPGVRNSWHSHAVGQILLCTDGIGYYQEKGGEARRLGPGDVVNIPADVEHWHGATPDSRFSHIGITPKVGE